MTDRTDKWDEKEHEEYDEEHIKNCPDCQKASEEINELAHETWHNVVGEGSVKRLPKSERFFHDGAMRRRCFNCPRDATYFAVSYAIPKNELQNDLERNFQIGEVLHGLQSNDFKLTTQVLPVCDECENKLNTSNTKSFFDQQINNETLVVGMSTMRFHHDKHPEMKRTKSELEVDNLQTKFQYSMYDLISDMESCMTKAEIIKQLNKDYKMCFKMYWTLPSDSDGKSTARGKGR